MTLYIMPFIVCIMYNAFHSPYILDAMHLLCFKTGPLESFQILLHAEVITFFSF